MKKRRARRTINLRQQAATATDGLHDVALAIRRAKRRLRKTAPGCNKEWVAYWASQLTWELSHLIGDLVKTV